jgi:hypothetical protein
VVLVRCLLVLLALAQVSIPLFCLALYAFFLLRSMLLCGVRLHQLSFPRLALSQLSFPLNAGLRARLHRRLLQGLR